MKHVKEFMGILIFVEVLDVRQLPFDFLNVF